MIDLLASGASGLPEDDDEGLELREDVVESLKDFLDFHQCGDDADDGFRALGLE